MMIEFPLVVSVIAGGFLMGLASSLHCAGQCGGIASSLLIATGQSCSGRKRAQDLLAMQLGRTVTYTIAGGIVGVAGGALGHIFDLAGLQPVLRILGAAMLMWVGLALIGVLPSPQILDRRLVAASMILSGRNHGAAFKASSALLLGMTWGVAPCAMVYNALMTAMLSDTPVSSALFMMCFGLATVPTVALTAFGTAHISFVGSSIHKSAMRRAVGLAIAVLGLSSMAMPAATLTELCMR